MADTLIERPEAHFAGKPQHVGARGAERTHFGACGLRQSLFALALLLLLPFATGATVMLARRLADGVWWDLAPLALVAAGLYAVMALFALELLYSLRARVVLGKPSFTYTLPKNVGPTPLLAYTSGDIPYHAIKSVELRREVFGGKLAPVLLRGLVVRTKDNREIVLGHTLEGFEDPVLPFAEIAERIAARAALPLVDQRTVWRRSRKERALGYISSYDTDTYILDPAEAERLATAHRRLMLGIISALTALVILGLLAELSA